MPNTAKDETYSSSTGSSPAGSCNYVEYVDHILGAPTIIVSASEADSRSSDMSDVDELEWAYDRIAELEAAESCWTIPAEYREDASTIYRAYLKAARETLRTGYHGSFELQNEEDKMARTLRVSPSHPRPVIIK